MEPQDRRRELLSQHVATAHEVYVKSIAEGMALPVVFVIDTADPDGRALVEHDPSYQARRPPVFLTALPLADVLAPAGPLRNQPTWRRAVEMVTQRMPAWQRAGEGWASMSAHQVHLVAVVAAGGFACHPVPLELPS